MRRIWSHHFFNTRPCSQCIESTGYLAGIELIGKIFSLPWLLPFAKQNPKGAFGCVHRSQWVRKRWIFQHNTKCCRPYLWPGTGHDCLFNDIDWMGCRISTGKLCSSVVVRDQFLTSHSGCSRCWMATRCVWWLWGRDRRLSASNVLCWLAVGGKCWFHFRRSYSHHEEELVHFCLKN